MKMETIVVMIRVVINENDRIARMKKASAPGPGLDHSLHVASSTLTIAFPLFSETVLLYGLEFDR